MSYGIIFALILGFSSAMACSYFSTTLGIRVILPTMVAASVIIVVLSVIKHFVIFQYWYLLSFCVVFGGFAGWAFAHFGKKFHPSEKTMRNIFLLKDNQQFSIVMFAFSLAICITPVFSAWVDWKSTSGFWMGFYQSWTSSLVAFLFLGMAGILVSLYRPSHDNFNRRVGYLFNTNDTSEIDYLSQEIQGIGYYAKRVHRIYQIQAYDSERKAFNVLVTHKSLQSNFLWDVPTPDKVTFKMIFDENDLLDPPIENMGELLSVLVDEEDFLGDPVPILSTGIDRHWKYKIPAGHDQIIETSHRCYYKANEIHSFAIDRLAKTVIVEIIYVCGDGGLPEIKIFHNESQETRTPVRGKPIEIKKNDYSPFKGNVFAFSLSEPKSR